MKDIVRLGYLLSNGNQTIVSELSKLEDNFEGFLYEDVEICKEIENISHEFDNSEVKRCFNFIYWLLGYGSNFDDFLSKWIYICNIIADFWDDRVTQKLILFNCILTGREAEMNFGTVLDWKEEIEDALYNLENISNNLGFEIDFELFDSDEDDLEEVLPEVGSFVKEQGYEIINLDMNSDCYVIFIVKSDKTLEILNISRDIGFKINKM